MAVVTQTMQDNVTELYLGFFGRAPDAAGFGYWTNRLAQGDVTIQQISKAFAATPEFVSNYAGLTPTEQVSKVYLNVLNRAADTAGLNYWVGQITSGTQTIADVVWNITNSAFLQGTGTADGALVANKVAVGEYFAITVASNDTNQAAIAYNLVTSAASSVAAAEATLYTNSYTLTTAPGEVVVGTGAVNVFNGILGTGSTLNTFDTVTGKTGSTNTLNVSDNTAGAFAMPASVNISNMNTVNLNRAGSAAGSNAVTVTNTTFGTGISAFNLTDSGSATTTGAVSITLNSANSVSAVSTGLAAFNGVTVVDTAAATATAGSTLRTVTITNSATTGNAIWGNAVNTVNLTNATSLTTVNAAAGTRALTVNVAGATGGGLTDATATSVTINSNATAAGALGTYTTAAATTVNFNTTTATGATVITAAAATTLNVGGSALATLTLTGSTALTTVAVSGTGGLAADLTAAATAVTALNFTNTAGTSTVTVNTATAVNGGAGVEVITVGAGTAAINLGTGNDTLILTGAALGTGGTANGGTGGTDTLQMTTANAATASGTTTFAAAVTGFERLTLTTAATTAIDVNQLGGYNYVTIANNAANTLTINNMASGGTVVIGGANGGVTFGGTLGSGVNDTVNLILNNAGAALVAFGTVTAPNVENVTISVNDTQATPDAVHYLNTVTIVDTSLRALTVTGTDGLAITHAGTALQSLDASGVTGGTGAANTGVTLTTGALQYASTVLGTAAGGDTLNFASALASVSITETAGTNSITGSSGFANTLVGGTGQDTIVGGSAVDTISVGASSVAVTNSVTGAAGADSINLTGSLGADTVAYGANATAAGAAGVNMDTVTNFLSGTDKINLTVSTLTAANSTNGVAGAGSTVATMAVALNDQVSVATVADVYSQLALDLVGLAASVAGANGIQARVVNFANGAAAGTYLVVNDGVLGFQAATDMVVKLVGTSPTVVAGDFSYTAVA